MHETVNEVLIRGTPEEIMRLAFDLPRWPEFLPHYRFVRVLEQTGERRTVEMACWRTGIPLRWISHLWVHAAEGRMRFSHIAGPARGMTVVWTLHPEGATTRVTIHHDLSLEAPLIRSALGRWVVGHFFVGAVAGRTLACLKRAVEGA